MKKLKSLFCAAALTTTQLAPPVAFVATLSACKTSPLATNYNSFRVLRDEVASTRASWQDWVYVQRQALSKLTDRNDQSAALLTLLAKETPVKAALELWFVQLSDYEAAAKASDEAIAAPPALLLAGNNYLTAVKTFKH